MRNRTALGLAASLAILCTADLAAAQNEPLKPYILFVLDVSGSMAGATGSGPPSCPGAVDTKLDHAKCAISRITNSFGDMIMGLGRFRITQSGACTDSCNANGLNCDPDNDGDGCTQDTNQTTGCTAAMASDDRFELLVPILENNESSLLSWNSFTCGSCSTTGTDPEIFIGGWTPIAGSLKGAKRYWQGLSSTSNGPFWTGPGDDPIRDDPKKNIFINGVQCRPYIVISLTDGEETCAPSFNDTTAAAASMLTTVVDTHTYRIETKAIGFGIAPGNAQIEGIAHAGGAADGSGNEGFYANNEEELSIAISQIVADALRFETCNDLDDDCDVLVDEDFPLKGQPCDNGLLGVCRRTGNFVCDTAGTGVTCVLNTPGGTATTETCDGLDNDCDGSVDEDACTGCGDVEICNNLDDDCDNLVDEDLTRACGTDLGICVAGTETCAAGNWINCTATGGTVETCNGLDDDCDGVRDGFAEECSTLPGGNPELGPCQPGTRVCPTSGTGIWGPCLGEIGPTTEGCNLIDDDCDGPVDEDTGGADCSSDCGVGTTVCVNGQLECQGSNNPQPEECNGFDDDCDTIIDEEIPDGGPCDDNGTLCVPGVLHCAGGTWICVGGEPPGIEVCDCEDNDCDDEIDEEPPALCASGATCIHCQCAYPCSGTEFPCPVGRYCSEDNFCLIDPCYGIECEPLPNGDATQCVEGECVRSCDLATCQSGFVCRGSDGECVPDDCTGFPERCTAGEFCVDGACVGNLCEGVTCGAGEYCQGGNCFSSCADVHCPGGQRCEQGTCVTDPCGAPCESPHVCNPTTGTCGENPCAGRFCPTGEWCNPESGDCEQDPCLGVVCPGVGQICYDGTCDVPRLPDAGVNTYVTAGGGGGCSAGGSAPGAGAGAALLLALAALLGLRGGARGPRAARAARGRRVQ